MTLSQVCNVLPLLLGSKEVTAFPTSIGCFTELLGVSIDAGPDVKKQRRSVSLYMHCKQPPRRSS